MLNDVFETGQRSIGFAKHLRKKMTSGEKRLWQKLRARRFLGYKFRRQAPLGPYIADFLCVEKKLIVEVDGGYHSSGRAKRHDKKRDAFFERKNFVVVRFNNSHVLSGTDDVLERISTFLSAL